MNKGTRVIVSVLVGVALAALIAFVQTPATSSSGVAGGPIGGSFAGLINQNGQVVTQEDFASKTQLVFFGFTHCPAICPTELQRMTSVLKKLKPAARAQLAVIFVTVDPARDTPTVLHDYLGMFHPDITALTGDAKLLAQTRSDWKVYAAKIPLEDGQDYTMDHSAFLYLRGSDGTLQGLFQPTDSPALVLKAVQAALNGQKAP